MNLMCPPHRIPPPPQLPSLGISQQFISFTNVTMESDKFICVRETAPQNSVVIIDMASPMSPMKRPITADSAIMNPNQKIIALKAKIGEGPGDNLQIFNLEQKTKLKSVALTEAVVYWRWITTTKLGLVTATSVYHWDMVVCVEDGEKVEYSSGICTPCLCTTTITGPR